jgi:uncharacterized protein YndB with AHSA1/START domain
MTATQDSATTQDDAAREVQVSRVYIKASADAIWTALTDPEWTNRYGYKGYHQYDLRPGGTFQAVPSPEFRAEVESAGYPCPDVLVDGEVIEAEAPLRLVTTWRMLMDPTTAAEPMTTITYEIKQFDGFCSLTVAHDVTGAPVTAAMVRGDGESDPESGGGGGHPWILSDLKSLLETGSVLAG